MSTSEEFVSLLNPMMLSFLVSLCVSKFVIKQPSQRRMKRYPFQSLVLGLVAVSINTTLTLVVSNFVSTLNIQSNMTLFGFWVLMYLLLVSL